MKSLVFDTGTIVAFNRTEQGYLKVKIRVTKPGVFTYFRPGYGKKRELRRPEEVFSEKTLKSIATSILTNEHPVNEKGESILIDTNNTKAYQVGYPSGKPYVENDEYISLDAIFTDQSAIADIEAGKREISWGSTCNIVEKSGQWNGFSYDWEQRNLESNHIALTSLGRCGSDVGIVSTFDSVGISETGEDDPKMKIEIDGIEHEVSESLGKSIQSSFTRHAKEIGELQDRVKTYRSENAKLEASYDSLKSDFIKMKSNDSANANEEEIKKKIKELSSLYSIAKDTLPLDKFKSLDSIDPCFLKTQILSTNSPNFDFSKKSPEYIDARFDIFLESKDKNNGNNHNFSNTILENRLNNTDSEDGKSLVQKAREEAIKKSRNRWKTNNRS